MVTAILVSVAGAETHIVRAYDMTFEPEVIEVRVGDTIRWEYVSGTPHTVTSGEPCTWDGGFYAGLSVIDPVFELVVPVDAAEEIPYFCAPHCVNGMVGLIVVTPPCSGDLDGDSVVDGDDLLVVLANWATTGPEGDADGSGTVDGDDLLIILGGWGGCG